MKLVARYEKIRWFKIKNVSYMKNNYKEKKKRKVKKIVHVNREIKFEDYENCLNCLNTSKISNKIKN